MSTSVSLLPASDGGQSIRAPLQQTPLQTAVQASKRPILISPISGPMASGADPMALFDSLLVSVDITGPQILRSSRYASRIYHEMQRLMMRVH